MGSEPSLSTPVDDYRQLVPTTDRDQPSFVNDLYYPTRDNIIMPTQPMVESNIAKQLQMIV
jgi:hypothetical protein